MNEETAENRIIRNEDGTFKEGTAPGPGRPEDTPEKALVKRAVKELIKEYKEDLAQYLPQIRTKLGEKAVAGDIQFIKELHDRVMGKAEQYTDITSGGEKVIPIINVSTNNSDKQDTGNEETSKDSTGGNVSQQDNINPTVSNSDGTVGQEANAN
jgi:hypothetical protein